MNMAIFSKVCETIGVMAFAISGSMIAVRRKVDLFGVVLLSIITAVGGGFVRDVVFSWSPPVMFEMYDYLFISVTFAVGVFLWARKYKEVFLTHGEKVERVNDIFDSLGLGIFAVSGTMSAIEHGYANKPVLVLSAGLLTCIGGGILRDVLTKCVPFVLVKHIYAIAALSGSVVYYILYLLHVPDSIAIIAGFLTTFVLRILAMTFKWNFPKAIE